MIKNVEFKTPNNEVLQETNLARLYDDMSQKIVKESEDFEGRDSGWTLDEILRLEVRTNRYSPFRGSSSFIEVPKQIAETKAIINVINKKDSQCFMWSILAALYPNTSNPNKTSSYVPHLNKLNFDGISFPTPLNEVKKFSKMNDIGINIYSFEEDLKIFPLLISDIVSNNRYMSNFNPDDEIKYLMYLDANNLYGYAMSKHLPLKDFVWSDNDLTEQDILNLSDESDVGYILEVDLEYPSDLHDKHSDFPLAPENKPPPNCKEHRLLTTLEPKTKYVLHYSNLKLYLKLGRKQLDSAAGTNNSTRQSERNNSNSSVGTKQLNSALPSTAYNRLQPPAPPLQQNRLFLPTQGPSKENPADIVSRGIDPKCLPDCKLWWQGPPWLRLETSSWPKAESSCDETSDEVKAEQKSASIFNLFTHTSNDVIHGLLEHYSSLTKIIRIFAYCQRFIKNCKKIASQESSISSSHINTTSLTFSETKTAEETIIRWVQGFYFQEEIQSIKKQISLQPKSPLRSLHPFIDEHGLVRVGGRLQNSQLRFNSKHPIILPSQHSISELLIKEQHIAHLHAGPTLLAHVLRQSHWIVGSRKLINKCIRKCLKCNKFKTSTTTQQLMGNLPKHRVTLERPFFSCGIDYAGPVLIKCNKGRGTKSTKGYIALFVCLATKAVHIEAVGDLTTDSFIAALRHFSAPRHIYSDNGTNFVGARRKLDEIRKLWLSLPTNMKPYLTTYPNLQWIGTLFHPHHHILEVFGNQEFDPSNFI
ncbi:hypothetical protein TNCV_5003331 [Trichonephila clavipes]|nr:hypothetical protein TNCV_5003331 [Trichonephila clavipes]